MQTEPGLLISGLKALEYAIMASIGLVTGLLGGLFRAGEYKNKIVVLETGHTALEKKVDSHKEKTDDKLDAHMRRIQDKLEDMNQESAERHVKLIEKIGALVK